jgi:hypothetical protein
VVAVVVAEARPPVAVLNVVLVALAPHSVLKDKFGFATIVKAVVVAVLPWHVNSLTVIVREVSALLQKSAALMVVQWFPLELFITMI